MKSQGISFLKVWILSFDFVYLIKNTQKNYSNLSLWKQNNLILKSTSTLKKDRYLDPLSKEENEMLDIMADIIVGYIRAWEEETRKRSRITIVTANRSSFVRSLVLTYPICWPGCK